MCAHVCYMHECDHSLHLRFPQNFRSGDSSSNSNYRHSESAHHSLTLHRSFTHMSFFLQTPAWTKISLPWWWAAEGKEHSASRQKRPRSNGSTEAQGRAGPANLLQCGITDLGWSYCSLCSGGSMKLHRHVELC